jgi:hypothetical protein
MKYCREIACFLSSSTDIIVNFSSDFKKQEFNPEVEKLLGNKHGVSVNQNFIALFITEALRKKDTKRVHQTDRTD